ncbi:MAG: hypothetical protein M1820_002667 [Bogoriella megaspora]|nr:MAG: hypothetical protein M1820_002667 [Bogoriella megaspora]
MEDDDDDMPQLSASALAALQEFSAERDDREKQFTDLQNQAKNDFQAQPLSMDAFSEDWNSSQFWIRDGANKHKYSNETATILARQLLNGASKDTTIAVVSAPSAFVQLKNILVRLVSMLRCVRVLTRHEAKVDTPDRPQIVLLEYDERFAVFRQDFVSYDFQQPLKLPPALKAKFGRIICDPPFLSEDCQTKAALTVRWLSKAWATPDLKLIVCTGERMQPVIEKLYGKAGVRTTTFEPLHAKGLSNEFRCYANFECDHWTWR